MASKPSSTSLYGIPRPKSTVTSQNPISSSASLAFGSQLSSLIAQSGPKSATSARARPSKSRKDDIFSSHNKGAKKRAAADISTDASPARQAHQTDIGSVDSATLHRSKRKMEEKARLYAAMKRGDYVPPQNSLGGINDERQPLVDFDRKWAENEATGKMEDYDTSSGSDHGESGDEELVEFVDEFGRLRDGTRAEAAKEERRRRVQTFAREELESMSARPVAPQNLIYGDTVQAAAFNPDEPVVARMEELARKRDKSMTPPDEVHYDATKEVRTKGVGFYQFSGDKEGRAQEMENLERERKETERRREEREQAKAKRKKEIEERRQALRERRGEKLAEKFLDELNETLGT